MTLSEPNHQKSPPFYVSGLFSYLWNGWSWNVQDLFTGRPYQFLALGDKLLPNGRGHGHVTHFWVLETHHIFGMGSK